MMRDNGFSSFIDSLDLFGSHSEVLLTVKISGGVMPHHLSFHISIAHFVSLVSENIIIVSRIEHILIRRIVVQEHPLFIFFKWMCVRTAILFMIVQVGSIDF